MMQWPQFSWPKFLKPLKPWQHIMLVDYCKSNLLIQNTPYSIKKVSHIQNFISKNVWEKNIKFFISKLQYANEILVKIIKNRRFFLIICSKVFWIDSYYLYIIEIFFKAIFTHWNHNMQMRFLSKLSKIKDFDTLFVAKYLGLIAWYLFII